MKMSYWTELVGMISVFFNFRYQAFTVMPAKSDSDVMFCLQSYQGFRIDISRVY